MFMFHNENINENEINDDMKGILKELNVKFNKSKSTSYIEIKNENIIIQTKRKQFKQKKKKNNYRFYYFIIL